MQWLQFERLRWDKGEGATMEEIMAATGWQSHSARSAMSGALGKKLALVVKSAREEVRGRVYRIGQSD